MPSILSGFFGDQLYKKLPSDHTLASYLGEGRYSGITFTARRCSRVNQVGWHQPMFSFVTQTVLTGGLQITATVDVPPYLHANKFVANLKPGWTYHRYLRAFNRLSDKAMEEKVRIEHVTKCWNVSNPFVGHVGFLAAVEEHEKTCTHTVEYDKMSVEAADYWTDWVNEWKKSVKLAS